MDSRAFYEELKKYQGCLRKNRTLDEAARRRHDDHEAGYEDGWREMIGGPYWRDIRKFQNSRAYRKLWDKTQSRIARINANGRTRGLHSNEVADFAGTIARVLGLNHELAYAGGLMHDSYHTPKGHLGENYLRKRIKNRFFRHNIMGSVGLQFLERDGLGLNLTHQVLRCIVAHNPGESIALEDMSDEEKVVWLADKGSNLSTDFSDIIHGRMERESELLGELIEKISRFGSNQWDIATSLIKAIIIESAEMGKVSFSESDDAKHFWETRDILYKVLADIMPITNPVDPHIDLVVNAIETQFPEIDSAMAFTMMTDSEIRRLNIQILQGQDYLYEEDLMRTSLADSLPALRKWGHDLDWSHPHLDW